MGFLRTILIILLFYYGFKIISRFLAPYLLRYMARKAQQPQKNPFDKRKRTQKKEGEISIDTMPKQKQSVNNKVGEYVDYEEID